MKKTIKIIDLLNKIANGEEVPKKIDYNGEIFIYNETLKRYVHEINKYSDSSTYCLGGYFALDMSLDHEVKVLEELEDKEYDDIEKIDTTDFGISDTFDIYETAINRLIKNQKKIIEKLNKNNNTQ